MVKLRKDGTPKKSGRPRIPEITPDIGDLEGKLPPRPIDWEKVFYWMNLDATQEEIAGSFHVSVSTLQVHIREKFECNFHQLKERCCGLVKVKLRDNQFKLSSKNATIAIWLGKIWLGQKDPDRQLEIQKTNELIELQKRFLDHTRVINKHE